jgi:hypothetical protein
MAPSGLHVAPPVLEGDLVTKAKSLLVREASERVLG